MDHDRRIHGNAQAHRVLSRRPSNPAYKREVRRTFIPASLCRGKHQKQSGEYQEACETEELWQKMTWILDKRSAVDAYPYPRSSWTSRRGRLSLANSTTILLRLLVEIQVEWGEKYYWPPGKVSRWNSGPHLRHPWRKINHYMSISDGGKATTLAFSNSTNPNPRNETNTSWWRYGTPTKKNTSRTSHDTTVDDTTITIEKFGYIFGPGISRKSYNQNVK